MISSLVKYKDLDAQYKSLLNVEGEIDPERIVYVLKDAKNKVKAITTSIFVSIRKVKENKWRFRCLLFLRSSCLLHCLLLQ